ncbi:SusC/RagA family TonB-linked outer membrane protein [Rhizosphaericola mali]|uniref:TonB-dependent receptor n=1 Tax=Rhizosphaericola mali TaxID=2545455 RepID=A0A5P2GDL0_9BACT|nr:TonB-dependent receptor [Rhizosphaericola mali]QES89691.1 TonB-dependent receptor [Rhizosphaericola mali]
MNLNKYYCWIGKIYALFLLFLIPYKAFEQIPLPTINSVLEGKITDSRSHIPLDGVSVNIKGTTNQSITNEEGKFILRTGQKFPYILQVNYIGYKSLELTINQSTINIELVAINQVLSDVVVVGYGTQKRSSLVGAISTIDPEQNRNLPVASIDAQLQGMAAGLQINSNTGVPGDAVFVRVRGTTSINAGNDPLYIIDGVFLNNTSLQTVNTGGRATSPLADISSADIESVEVLKDASATAIYGSRGANGVIIITTKHGHFNARPLVTADISHGLAWAPKLWDLTTGEQHAELINEFYVNSYADALASNNAAGITKYKNLPFSGSVLNPGASTNRGAPDLQKTYNRLGELFRTGQLSNYDLSIQGGNDKTRYYIGANYLSQEADIKPVSFNRGSFKVNIDQKVSNRVTIGTSNILSRSYRNQARAGDGPQGGLLQSALHTPTYLPEVNTDGTPARWAGFDNLEVLLNNYNVHTTSLRYVGNVYADAELFKNLRFRTSWSIDYNSYNESEYWNDKTQLGASPTNGLATSSITQNSSWINEQTLSYKLQSKLSTFDFLIGNSLISNITQNTSAQGTGFPNNSYTQISSASTVTGGQSWTKGNLASYFSRIGYNYLSKYFLEVSLRADGSSKFGANNRWGYFPSVGASWRLKQEDFLKNVDFLSDLKLRFSYGIAGNQNGIDNYAALGLWSGGAGYPDNSTSGDKAGTAPQQVANPDLKWERTAQTNIGMNMGFLHNRLTIEFNLYSKITTNLLLAQPVAASTGFSTYTSNSGKISNKGYEFSINSTNIQTKDFSWNTILNFAGNKNRIITLETPITAYNRDWIRMQQGSPMYSFWLYKQLRVDPQTGNSEFQDVNNDGTITVADRQILGNAMPTFFGGLSNTLTYKRFDFNFLVNFQYGNKIFNLNRFFGEGGGTRDANRVLFASQLKRWQKVGDITDVPRLTAYGNNYTLEQNSRFLENGSFARLQTLTLGYTIPSSIVNKIGLNKIRFYFTGSNLFLITKYTGPDPEVNVTGNQNIQGLDLGTPPQPRTVQLGITINP